MSAAAAKVKPVKDKEKEKEKKGEKEGKKSKKDKKLKKQKPGTINIWGLEKIDATTFAHVDDFVKRCIAWLRRHKAQEKEGIFRKAGSEKRLLELQSDISFGEYSFPEDEDEHVVATVLKRFFRDMKAPLLTFDLYDTFIGADAFEGDERMQNVQQALKLLPEHHLKILETVVRYLHEVATFSAQNFMTANNIAIVFAPNLLRPKVETPLTLISDAGHVTALIASLIQDCDTYFPKVAVASPAVNKEDFKKTMNIKYVAHQTLTSTLVAQMAKEAHLTDEEMQNKLKVIGNRIKKGDKKALGLLFADDPDELSGGHPVLERIPTNGSEGKSPNRRTQDDASPLSSPRRDSNADDGKGPDGRRVSRPTAARIPKSLDLFGGASPVTPSLSLTAPAPSADAALTSSTPLNSTSSGMTKSPSSSGLVHSSSSNSLSVSSGAVTPPSSNGGTRDKASRARSREHKREGHADLSLFLKQILQNNELVEAAWLAESKESEALADSLSTSDSDDDDDAD